MGNDIESLRAEMLKWQDRRFDLLKHSTGVVTGLLGFSLLFEKGGNSSVSVWPLVSAMLLLYLSGANLLTWYSGIANTKLGAYLKVFHEEQATEGATSRWEGRLAILKKKHLDPHNLNLWITVIYMVLGLVSIVLPYAATHFTAPECSWLIVLLVCAAPFMGTLILVAKFSYPRDRFVSYWQIVKRDEEAINV